jgi:cysteine desulfurase
VSVYLDYNATAPMRPEAKAAVVAAMDVAGNASSVHAAGRKARDIAERGRAAVAGLLGVRPEQVIFTSGGTEANAQAVANAVRAGSRRLIVSAAEHPCILKAADAAGVAVESWPINPDGVAELAWLDERLARWDAADGAPFVALVTAQNETGVLQPVAEAAARVRAAGGRLHTDAIQAAGKVPLDFAALGADTVALSAHKLGGPQGIGALVYTAGAPPAPLLLGGEQESGRRAGTLNVQGVAGFGAAAQAAIGDLEHAAEHAAWRDAAAERLKQAGGVTVFGEAVARLPNTLAFAAEGFANDRQLMALDLAGVMVSAGSACSSGKMKPSRVIAAMGFEDLAGSMLRVSGGWDTTEADWDRFTQVWLEAWERHRARRAA